MRSALVTLFVFLCVVSCRSSQPADATDVQNDQPSLQTESSERENEETEAPEVPFAEATSNSQITRITLNSCMEL